MLNARLRVRNKIRTFGLAKLTQAISVTFKYKAKAYMQIFALQDPKTMYFRYVFSTLDTQVQ